jgi:hypothetical protein
MYALIHENKVVQIEGQTFPVAQGLQWMECSNDCKVGWVLINGVLQPKPEPEKTQEELLALYTEKLQQHIDLKASEKDYKNSVFCVSYKDSTVQQWAQEATDFIAWRDACWQYAIDIQSQVEGGQITPPSINDFIANAPIAPW